MMHVISPAFFLLLTRFDMYSANACEPPDFTRRPMSAPIITMESSTIRLSGVVMDPVTRVPSSLTVPINTLSKCSSALTGLNFPSRKHPSVIPTAIESSIFFVFITRKIVSRGGTIDQKDNSKMLISTAPFVPSFSIPVKIRRKGCPSVL